MESQNFERRWTQKELVSIEFLLSFIYKVDSESIRPWFSSPQHLAEIVGIENCVFIRFSWYMGSHQGTLSYNILNILYQKLIETWTDEIYRARTARITQTLISQYSDWWEKPIFLKWFENRENLTQLFGKKGAANIISSICISEYKSHDPRISTPVGTIPPDGNFISLFNIIGFLRGKLPGQERVINKISAIKKLNIYQWIFLLIPVFYLIIDFLSEGALFFVSINIFGYLGEDILILGLILWFIAVLLFWWVVNLSEIDNFWFRILIISLFFNLIDAVIITFIIVPLSESPFLFYFLSWGLWALSIYSILTIKKHNITKEDEKYLLGTSFLVILSIVVGFSAISVISFFTLNWILLIDIFGILILLYGLYASLYIEAWIRKSNVKPLRIYEEWGLLEGYAFALAQATQIDPDEILRTIDLDLSIQENYKKFGIIFKKNMNKTFKALTEYKDEIMEKIVPACPAETSCPILEQKGKELINFVGKKVEIGEEEKIVLEIKVFDQLPEDIREYLKLSEDIAKIFALKDFRAAGVENLALEKTYGFSVLFLAISLESLIKHFVDQFLRDSGVRKCLGEYRKEKENWRMPIVKIGKSGVKRASIGWLIKVLKTTCEYPENCEIKQLLKEFLSNNLNVKLEHILGLKEFIQARNDYAHIIGTIITKDQYIDFRGRVIEFFNRLKVDISNIEAPVYRKTKIKIA